MQEEIWQKAKTAASAEELLALAKTEGIEMTKEQAEEAFLKLHTSAELADEELDNVSGGGCGSNKPSYRLFAERAHVMWYGYQYCHQTTSSRNCMSMYWIVTEQDADTGRVIFECPLCGMRDDAFIGGLTEV